jgi:hypothetical protein
MVIIRKFQLIFNYYQDFRLVKTMKKYINKLYNC